MSADIREVINKSAMSRFQIVAVAICVGLNMIDGFDVLAMSFTSSGVTQEWSLNSRSLGVLLSAGLFGMAAGSLFLAPWADRFGRRSIILFSLVIVTIGMLLSANAQSFNELAALRVIAGIGIGGILASATVIVSEYSSDRGRSAAISYYTGGYPIGATIGGFIASLLIAEYGWRSAFLFGSFISALMIPLVYFMLPESLDFLLAKRPRNALQRLNVLLRRMHHPEVSSLPAPAATTAVMSVDIKGLFAGAALRNTLMIWASFFFLMAAFYFINSWTPRILATSGFSAQQGINGGLLVTLGGVIGTFAFGALCTKVDVQRLTLVTLAASIIAFAAFGFSVSTLPLALFVAVLIGAFTNGAMAGLYSLAPVLYPAHVRTTAMGWAIGMGRVGAILSPTVAGVMIDDGWLPIHLYYVFIIPLVLACVAVGAVRR
jgi:benzoate transport